MNQGGGCDNRDANRFRIRLRRHLDEFATAEHRRGVLRIEILLSKQLHKHRSREFVAVRASRHAQDAAGGRGKSKGSVFGDSFVRGQLRL
jgi:hypothetical protein